MMLDLAMGSSEGSPYAWISEKSTKPSSYSYGPRRSSIRRRAQGNSNLESTISFVYIIALLSWVSALYLSGQSKEQFATLHKTQVAIEHQYKSQLATIKDIKTKVRNIKSSIDRLKKTGEALQHELHVIHELEQGASDVSTLSLPPANRNLVDSWLMERQDLLKRRMEYLQQYVQSYSKQQVLERWGNGPHHRVAFTVEYKNEQGESYSRQIVVELASVHDMPHSVHMFLEMVEVGIWDHTVLLHHENIDHLIAGVPIDFRQQQFKHSHLAYLGWTKLAFPEYHAQYKHEKYTLGFANSGPTWYFNTVDNTESHGPGGQAAKKLLDNDADPCFARVVQGHDVVDELIELGLHQHQVEFEQGHPWADEPHTWTHLVKAEIVR